MAMNFDSQTMPEGESSLPVPPLSPEELAEHLNLVPLAVERNELDGVLGFLFDLMD